jgi:hypothetical protein
MYKRSFSCGTKRIYIKRVIAGHWWLMPVTLATQEAETRRIEG